MKSPLSPLDLSIIIHYYSSDSPSDRESSDAAQESIAMWEQNGFLVTSRTENKITTQGRAFVEMLCNTPPPRLAYIDPNNNVVLLVLKDIP